MSSSKGTTKICLLTACEVVSPVPTELVDKVTKALKEEGVGQFVTLGAIQGETVHVGFDSAGFNTWCAAKVAALCDKTLHVVGK